MSRNQKEELLYSNQVLSSEYSSPVYTIKSFHSDEEHHIDIDGYLAIINRRGMYDLLIIGKFTVDGKEEYNQTNIIIRDDDEKWLNYLKYFPNIDHYTRF